MTRKTSRDIIDQLNRIECMAGCPLIECLDLILKWRNSPDVILAATERIHEITKERMEVRR